MVNSLLYLRQVSSGSYEWWQSWRCQTLQPEAVASLSSPSGPGSSWLSWCQQLALRQRRRMKEHRRVKTLKSMRHVCVKDIWFVLTAHTHDLYLEYQQTSCRSRGCIWGPESSRKPTSPLCHQNGSHTEMEDILYGANHLVINNIIRISEIIKGDWTFM